MWGRREPRRGAGRLPVPRAAGGDALARLQPRPLRLGPLRVRLEGARFEVRFHHFATTAFGECLYRRRWALFAWKEWQRTKSRGKGPATPSSDNPGKGKQGQS